MPLATNIKNKIVTVVGARPQFIKSAPVSLALELSGAEEIIIHTGQHYDQNMSDIFFDQLKLKPPKYQLDIGSGSHAYQTGEALKRIEPILKDENPYAVLVYGDTNATLAGALAAAKLNIPIAHVEAGLRSFNRKMPEEINRVLCDHISRWLFAPTTKAVENLEHEGITQGVHLVGDVMLDAVELFSSYAESACADNLQKKYGIANKQYLLLTIHRAETTTMPDKIIEILSSLNILGIPVLFPVHPRTRQLIESLQPLKNIIYTEPLGYFDMLAAEKQAKTIITDSGGVQKEAAFFEVPCITLREETEWVETVDSGWNRLIGLSGSKLLETMENLTVPSGTIKHLYGNGETRLAISNILSPNLCDQADNPVFGSRGLVC